MLVTSTFDSANRDTSDTVHNTGGDLTTSYGYDQRGLQTFVTDPRGYVAGHPLDPNYTTNYSYDPLGRPSATQNPPVAVEENGGTPSTVTPTSTVGYDTYGDITQTEDARGLITTTAYDILGRKTSVTYPSYTPKGSSTAITPTGSFTYDLDGNVLTHVDRLGQTTSNTYDMRSRPVRVIAPPATTGAAQATTRYTYDDNNEKLSTVDPRGATTQTAYDDLGHVWATTQIERTPSNAAYTTYTLTDNNGNITETIAPGNNASGVASTTKLRRGR